MNSKQYIKTAVQINSNTIYICITCKLMLGTGIVTFIPPAAGQLVWRIYSEGTGFRDRSLD